GDRRLAADPVQPRLHRRQRSAAHVLHRDEEAVADFSDLEELDKLRMRQQAARLGLVDEHVDERGIIQQLRKDPLDHHGSLEALRANNDGEEYLRHSSDADSIEKVVVPEGLRAGEGRQMTLNPHTTIVGPSRAKSYVSLLTIK